MSKTVVWKEITLSEQGYCDNDYRSLLVIKRNGVKEMSFYDGEPEDANLSRDFRDCFSIMSLVEEAYEAGKRGDSWEFDYEEVDTQV